MKIEVKSFQPLVGLRSLVYIDCREFPVEFGNYCTLRNGPYLVNLWAENLKEWARRNPGENIEVTTISDGETIGVVTDKRLQDWCHNDRLCVTGHGWPSPAAKTKAEEIVS